MSRTPFMTGKASDSGAFRASMKVSAGVALVTLVGRLEPSAMPTCRSTLDAVLRIRAPQIVLDLSQAQLDPESVDLLEWMHGYVARFGVQLSLTGVHHLQLQMLRQDLLDGVLAVLPTDPDQKRAAARAERRNRSPGLEIRRPDSQNMHRWDGSAPQRPDRCLTS